MIKKLIFILFNFMLISNSAFADEVYYSPLQSKVSTFYFKGSPYNPVAAYGNEPIYYENRITDTSFVEVLLPSQKTVKIYPGPIMEWAIAKWNGILKNEVGTTLKFIKADSHTKRKIEFDINPKKIIVNNPNLKANIIAATRPRNIESRNGDQSFPNEDGGIYFNNKFRISPGALRDWATAYPGTNAENLMINLYHQAAMHEIGHLLGLSHPPQGSDTDSDIAMDGLNLFKFNSNLSASDVPLMIGGSNDYIYLKYIELKRKVTNDDFKPSKAEIMALKVLISPEKTKNNVWYPKIYSLAIGWGGHDET